MKEMCELKLKVTVQRRESFARFLTLIDPEIEIGTYEDSKEFYTYHFLKIRIPAEKNFFLKLNGIDEVVLKVSFEKWLRDGQPTPVDEEQLKEEDSKDQTT